MKMDPQIRFFTTSSAPVTSRFQGGRYHNSTLLQMPPPDAIKKGEAAFPEAWKKAVLPVNHACFFRVFTFNLRVNDFLLCVCEPVCGRPRMALVVVSQGPFTLFSEKAWNPQIRLKSLPSWYQDYKYVITLGFSNLKTSHLCGKHFTDRGMAPELLFLVK